MHLETLPKTPAQDSDANSLSRQSSSVKIAAGELRCDAIETDSLATELQWWEAADTCDDRPRECGTINTFEMARELQ